MGQTHSRMSWQTPHFQPCQHGAAVEHHPAELVSALAAAFADGIGRFVASAAEHPELNQIMVHEGTTATDRLKWPDRNAPKAVPRRDPTGVGVLRKAGVAALIDNEILYYVLIGAASLPYVNASEVRFLGFARPVPGHRTVCGLSPRSRQQDRTRRPRRSGALLARASRYYVC
jgi:hypothetical protein